MNWKNYCTYTFWDKSVFFFLSYRHCECPRPKFPGNCYGDYKNPCTKSNQCGKDGVCTKYYGGTGKKYVFQVFLTLNQVHTPWCTKYILVIFSSIIFWITILWHHRYCVCRSPLCIDGDICNKDKDCGTYLQDENLVQGTCEKTITDRSEGDLWLYTDMKWVSLF